jgi:hypothetical protein
MPIKPIYLVQFAQKKRHTHVSKHINNNVSKHQWSPHHPKLDTSPSKPQFVKKLFNEKSKLLCSRCRKTGHLASNCRVKLQPKQEKIMTAIHAYTALDKHVELLQLSGTVDGFIVAQQLH